MIGRYPPPPPPDEGRSDTLWEGGKDNCESLVWVYFLLCRLYCMLKLRCLLHDVPPQTFIRPPMMAAFHIVVMLLTRYNCSVFSDIYSVWMLAHTHSGVYGLFSRLSWGKENRVPDKCSWRVVDRHGARRHRSSIRRKVWHSVDFWSGFFILRLLMHISVFSHLPKRFKGIMFDEVM